MRYCTRNSHLGYESPTTASMADSQAAKWQLLMTCAPFSYIATTHHKERAFCPREIVGRYTNATHPLLAPKHSLHNPQGLQIHDIVRTLYTTLTLHAMHRNASNECRKLIKPANNPYIPRNFSVTHHLTCPGIILTLTTSHPHLSTAADLPSQHHSSV